MTSLPFPLELVLNCRALAMVDALTSGATINILLAYWRSGCAPLPTNDANLTRLAGCSSRQWRTIRECVKPAINEAESLLVGVYAKLSEKKRKQRANAAHAGRASAMKRQQAVKPPVGGYPPLTDNAYHPQLFQPVKHSQPYFTGKYDPQARQAVINKAKAKPPFNATMRDK